MELSLRDCADLAAIASMLIAIWALLRSYNLL